MRKLKPFLFITLTFSVVLIAIELLIRAVNPREESSRSAIFYNHKFGHYLKGSDWINSLPKDNKLNINHSLVSFDKDIGIKRVLFMGDSGTRGVGLEDREIFTSRLQEKAMLRAEIINAGVPGSNNVNQLMLLKQKFYLLKPDHIILGIFLANDINFNLLNYDPAMNNSRFHRYFEKVRNSSALVNLVYYRLISLTHKSSLFEFQQNEEVWPTSWLKTKRGLHYINYIEGEYSLYLKEKEPLVEKSYEILENILAQFKNFTAKKEIKFTILLLPSPSTVLNKGYFEGHEITVEMNKNYKIKPSDLDFQLPLKRTIEICKNLGIPYINPLPQIRPLGLKAFLNDDHFSAKGHDVLYKIIYDLLDPTLPAPR